MLRLSTKQKREVYSLSSLLLHLIIFIVLLVSLNSCSSSEDRPEPDTCTTLATVKDMRGLDGCGFVLVLDNGQKLEPVQPYNSRCGWAPGTTKSILANVELTDGKRVKIGYKESASPSICMVGQTVEITCITEVSPGTASPEPAL